MTWQTVDPSTIRPGDTIRASKGDVSVHARAVRTCSTSVSVNLDDEGVPLYLDEGWTWEVDREPVALPEGPGTVIRFHHGNAGWSYVRAYNGRLVPFAPTDTEAASVPWGVSDADVTALRGTDFTVTSRPVAAVAAEVLEQVRTTWPVPGHAVTANLARIAAEYETNPEPQDSQTGENR